MSGTPQSGGPAWMSWLGVATILFGVLFTAYAGNEWMRQLVIEQNTPPSLELPSAECPEDELEEEGISVAECEQFVSSMTSYVVSRPPWFASVMAWLMALATLVTIFTVVCGAGLANYRPGWAGIGVVAFAALAVLDAGQFIAAQQAGPILRAIHLPVALTWFFVHLSFALAFNLAKRQDIAVTNDSMPVAYSRFEVVSHWFLALSVFFLFVSSWWMLALPLPSEDFRYREFPFQLHKNLGITIVLLLIAMAIIRVMRRQALAAVTAESPAMHRLRLGGHVALYALIFAVCVTGFMSSTYSGWATTWWWLIELPYWGHDNEVLNQFYSDLHLWTCWGLLIAMAAHIGAALLHAFRNDGVIRRIIRW